MSLSRSATSLTYVAFLLLILSFCTSTKEKKDENPASKLSKEEQEALADFASELEIGRNMAGRMLQFYGQIDSRDFIMYLNKVGSYVASYSDAPERRYMFSVLDTDSVNAFACPGGYILMTKGAIKLAKNEAELAMILGHEVAHVAKKHMYNTLKQMTKDEMDKNAADAEKNRLMPRTIKVRERVDPSEDENEFASLMARYLAGSAATGLSVIKAAKAGMSVIMDKGLDKALEFEADNEGVRYGIRAGYAPNGLQAFLKRLQKRTPKKEREILGKTHPTIKERLTKIAALMNELEAGEIIGASGDKRFEKFKADVE